MRIRMLKTQAGSIDGVRIDTYQIGAEYDMGKSDKHIELANIFVSERWAEIVENEVIAIDPPVIKIESKRIPSKRSRVR